MCRSGGDLSNIISSTAAPRFSAAVRTAMLLGCSLSPRLMPPRSVRCFVPEGELSAAVELRRQFPGITDNAKARACARTIAGWTPLPGAAPPGDTAAPPQGQLMWLPTAGIFHTPLPSCRSRCGDGRAEALMRRHG